MKITTRTIFLSGVRRVVRGLAVLGLLAGFGLHVAAEENSLERVIVLANSADRDSVRIAEHYAKIRGVPAGNIVALKMSTGETTSWRNFVAEIWQPLRDELIRRHLVEAALLGGNDAVGRKKYVTTGHRITALVICRGVPMRILHEPTLYEDNLPLTQRQEFRTNAGVVDSELGLLATSTYNINAFVPNPLFGNDITGSLDRAQIVSVGRLDGPAPEDAMALVDRAVAIERTGLIGRAYVDLGGIHPEGDRWLEVVASQLAVLGFDMAVDRGATTMPPTARADQAALYFGWYAADLNGPFALPGFQFAPGALALHIHSFSGGTMRSPAIGWTAPLVVRGVAGAVGNVNEPYLNLTHHPDALLRGLSRGLPLGEAALFALPALSWQTILVGDPLYRPFAVSFEEQWKNRANLPTHLAAYVVLRQANLLERAGKSSEALALLGEVQGATPSLPVGIALAERLQKSGDTAGAARALQFAATLKDFRSDEWALARDAAQLLVANSSPAPAVEIYRALFGVASLPRSLRFAWLDEAAKAARAAQHPLAQVWEKESAEFKPASGESKK
jgi:uncharacterized protein (TIGR03790 family)